MRTMIRAYRLRKVSRDCHVIKCDVTLSIPVGTEGSTEGEEG